MNEQDHGIIECYKGTNLPDPGEWIEGWGDTRWLKI